MLEIAPTPDPEWFEIAGGARMLMRPADSVMLEAGRMESMRAAREGQKPADVDHAHLVGCVVWGVIEWEGVALQGSTELAPITFETVSPLLRQHLAVRDKLDRDYVIPLLLREMEKNASAPSPNGTSTGAPTTAPQPAGSDAGPAADSADTMKSGPKPSRGKRSGRSSGAAAAN